MRPFCHLVIRGVSVDSPPLAMNRSLLSQLIAAHRTKFELSQKNVAGQLGVSLKTIQNWERGSTKPQTRFWSPLQALVRVMRKGSATIQVE